MKLRLLALALLVGSTGAICVSSAVSAAPRQETRAGHVASHAPATSPAQPASVALGTATSGSAPAAPSKAAATAQPQAVHPSGNVGTATATNAAKPAVPDWLAEINRYRAAAGLGPVTDQPAWDAGIRAHLVYAAKTPQADQSAQYASLHTENPSSPYYTSAGALEASRSDLYFGAPSSSAVQFIDGWLSAPFHAIGILRARLTQVAFASSGSAAGLDVIGGLDDSRPARQTPILFPGNGMTTNLAAYTGSESPDPIESCDWPSNRAQYGLPLVVLLPDTPRSNLTATIVGPRSSTFSTADRDLCVIDERTYHSSDPVYGKTGAQILEDDHAVLLIAQRPYSAGHYSVTIRQQGQRKITWSFTVAP